MNQNPHAKHRERIRERVINESLENFEDHQVLEYLLFHCIPQKDTNELAHKMLNEFGSLHHLFEAHPFDIEKRCKVSRITSVFLSTIPQIAGKYFRSKWEDKVVLNSTKTVGTFCLSLFAGKTIETLYVICLDTQRRLIHAVLLIEGTVDSIPFSPRKVIETAIQYQAAGIVLTHNHPGGSTKPSKSDIEATKKIITALDIMNIEFVDHIVVAGEDYTSFIEKRVLK